ncbi:hypothetical protein GCM10027047_12090 [Rhodococcus aerolatus]
MSGPPAPNSLRNALEAPTLEKRLCESGGFEVKVCRMAREPAVAGPHPTATPVAGHRTTTGPSGATQLSGAPLAAAR